MFRTSEGEKSLVLSNSKPSLCVLFVERLLSSPDVVAPETLLLTLLYSLFVFILALLGVGSVTYSVFHGFFGRPVKLLSAIRPDFVSFLALLATSIVTLVLAIGFITIVCVFAISVIKLYQLIEFDATYFSPYVASVLVILSVFLLLGLVCLAVNWNLACVIVVVESTWGLSPLKWSRNLVRGMQAVTLSLLLFFGFLAGMLIWSNSSLGLSGFGDKWKSWAFVVDIVVFSSFMTVLLQYNFSNIRLHYANVTVGTPPLSFLVALDMGNDLFWLPCDCSSCVRGLRTSRGQEIEFNIYSPNTSSTSSKAPCNSTMCGHKRRCSAQNTCPYEVVYLLMEHYLKGTW